MDNVVSKKFLQQYEMMVGWINETMSGLSEEDFKLELSPGKNHGVWILGHLVVCDDDFSLYMGSGDLLFPEYAETFGQGSKIKPVGEYPSVPVLKDMWDKVSEKNLKIYSELKDSEFDGPHALLTDPDKDFFKTKARVIQAWQLHQMYHNGQLGVLVSKAGKSRF